MKQFYILISFLLVSLFASAQNAPFITTWEVTSNSLNIVIPTNTNYQYNYTVDFGDGTIISNHTTNWLSHYYNSPGVYTVSITGDFPAIGFHSTYNVRDKIRSVEQWGDIQWQSFEGAFDDCRYLKVNAQDSPDLSQVTNISYMFNEAMQMADTGLSLDNWDVSNVTNMSYMFSNSNYNLPLNSWDVSSVEIMEGMFSNSSYNLPLNSWNVSNVTNMSSMFENNYEFNQYLDSWDVSNVSNTSKMFSGCNLFNQPLSTWNVSSVTNMEAMFSGCDRFNQFLNTWDVSNVTNMESLFSSTSFDQPVDTWDVSNVENMSYMFYQSDFNQPLNTWDVSSVTSTHKMFSHNFYFNQSLNNWDVSNVIDMSYMFENAIIFNSDIGSWDVSSVTDMSGLFMNAESFNQNIENWNTLSLENMYRLFSGARFFNQPLDTWDVSNVTNMEGVFTDSEKFNQPLSNWDVSNVSNMKSMFLDCTSFNQSLNSWDFSNIPAVGGMFRGAKSFNQDISSWSFHSSVNLSNFLDNSGLEINNYENFLTSLASSNLNPGYLGAEGLLFCNENSRNNLISLGWQIQGDKKLNTCSNNYPVGAFVVKFDIPSSNYNLNIPVSGSGFNYTIDFGDGTILYNQTTGVNHSYTDEGVYNIIITGDYPRLSFNYCPISIEQWGNMQWDSMQGAFQGCLNLNINALDTPDLSMVTDMSYMFEGCNMNDDIENWDVSNINNMERLFASNQTFNQPLNSWDVSSVNNMEGMFVSTNFNQPLNNWDVSNVTNMSFTFYNSHFFNQPLNNWDISSVTKLEGMFSYADEFSQPLNTWDVSNVVDMSSMFESAFLFDQPLNTWDVSNVINMDFMFAYSDYNQPVNNWDVSNVVDMNSMFSNASSFNQDLSDWNITTSSLSNFLNSTNLSIANYDAFLSSLIYSGLTNGYLSSGGLVYCNSSARDELINNFGWQIVGDSLSNECNILSGSILYDENNNGCDNSDVLTQAVMVGIINNNYNLVTFSNQGSYSIGTVGNYFDVSVINLPSYYSATPISTNVSFVNSSSATANFCLSANQAVEDLNITLIPVSEARPGFDADYQLVVQNIGTQTIANPSISLDFDNTMQTYVSASPNPSSTTANQLNFDFTSIAPFESKILDVTMNTFQPPTVNGDDILSFTASVTPNTNDYTPADNTFVYDQTVVNSYDPNDKQVLQGEEIYEEQTDEYLDYLIRFQNTGTASAINVRILDTLHPNLDYNTLKPINASHDYHIEVTDGNQVEFIFDNINLPDETSDEPGSHGFVAYKIKPKSSLGVGDFITGDAQIYFDFNAPIITNMVSTEVVDNLGTTDYDFSESLKVYPNPTQAQVYLTATQNLEIEKVTVYNLQGKSLLSFDKDLETLNVEDLSTGVYLMKIETNRGVINKQLIKK